MNEFYFDNVDILINHLLYKYKELPSLKLQKNLYFLFAFYSGNYQVEEKKVLARFHIHILDIYLMLILKHGHMDQL